MKRRLKDIKCNYCWKTFKPRHSYNKYCCIKCFQEATKIAKKCLTCWKDFITSWAHASIQKYCSEKCKNWAKIKRKCKWCWEEFIGWRKTNYCDKCHQKKCITCGKSFYWRPDDIACSPKCYDYYRRHKIVTKACENCGANFQWPVYKKYCCEDCMTKWKLKNTAETCNEKYWVPYTILREDVQKKNWHTYSVENQKIQNYLKTLWYDVECEYKIWRWSFDFRIWNTVIEYNPTYTHSPDIKTHYARHKMFEEYHKEKTKLALAYWLRCIHIFEWDWLDKICDLIKQKFTLDKDEYEVDMSKDNYMQLLNNWYSIEKRAQPTPTYIDYRWKQIRIYNCGVATFKKYL